jgi:hypothetical protein
MLNETDARFDETNARINARFDALNDDGPPDDGPNNNDDVDEDVPTDDDDAASVDDENTTTVEDEQTDDADGLDDNGYNNDVTTDDGNPLDDVDGNPLDEDNDDNVDEGNDGTSDNDDLGSDDGNPHYGIDGNPLDYDATSVNDNDATPDDDTSSDNDTPNDNTHEYDDGNPSDGEDGNPVDEDDATTDDKPTTQSRNTPSDGFQIQSWNIKRWANIHTKQSVNDGWNKRWMPGMGWREYESVKTGVKVVRHWITPVAKKKFSSQRSALKVETLQKKSHNDEAQARNEYLKVSAKVEDSHLQFLAIHDGIEVANKAIARESQETSSIKTNSAMPRDRYAPTASTAKFSVGPSTKSNVKYKINNAFCIYATSIHEKKSPSILHERPTKVEEEDALKFVTPQKRAKNERPTTFDGDNHDSSDSGPCSHSSSGSDDDHVDLFSFNVKDELVKLLTPSDDNDDADDDIKEDGAVSIKTTCNLNPRENQSVTPPRSYNSDDDSFSFDTAHLLPPSFPPSSLASASTAYVMEEYVQVQWCTTEDFESIHKSNVYLSDDPLLCSYNSRFSEDDDEWTSVPTQCPSKSVVTKKKIKKENAKPFECHKSNFVMPFPKPTCMTRASMHDFIPPDTPAKKGKLLSLVAGRDLPVRQLQHPWHGEFFRHCSSTVMNRDLQLNSCHSRKANHQANRTDLFDGDLNLFEGDHQVDGIADQFDGDLKPFEGDHQVDGIGTGIDIKGVVTFKLEDDDGQVHTISVPNSTYFPFLKKVLLAPHHRAKANHDMTSRPLSIWTATHGDFIIHHWNQGKTKRTVKMSKSTNNPTVRSASGTKNYRAYSKTIEALAAIDIGQQDQTNDKLVFEPFAKEMTRHPSLWSIQEVFGAQVASPFLRELGTLFWKPLTESEHCASCCGQQPKTLGNLEVSTPISGNSLRNKFHRLEALTQIDKAREYETIDALTSWYIQDLLAMKEDIEEYKFQIPNPMTIPLNAPFYFFDPISVSTCAQGKLIFFPLESRIKPQTIQQGHYHKTHFSDIASPYVDSNPRCPSKGV